MTEGRAGGAEETRGAQERGAGPEETRGAQEPGTGAGARSPREVADLVRRMVAGEDVGFGELFAEDAVFSYPFSAPGALSGGLEVYFLWLRPQAQPQRSGQL